ncbi:MAG TPA: adenosylmethionine--8-amino-7-oxononanoate transaminase [Elusimicrobiota bacterium]|nr:adenosylmethionine--8-amino-7-oxononanoate transaminase [Elusimicrobiota bacterium]
MKDNGRRQLIAWDKRYVWHPFTQQAEWEKDDPLVVRSGKGVYLKDMNGRRYMDGVSSLWVNVHGHRHPVLDRAVTDQLGKIAHSTFLGLTHEPAVRLARELIRIAPRGLQRVFYSDNGATSVEIALKMAFQSWAQSGRRGRTEFLALDHSYHGDTLGSVSVGGIGLFHRKFAPLLFKTRFAMSPFCYRCPCRAGGYRGRWRGPVEKIQGIPRPGDRRAETGCRWECLKHAEQLMREHASHLAAAIVEPVVQGAAGMVVMPPGYLKGFERLCRKYGILLIADEVATGFGRTGTMFACERERVRPDFLCVSKSITGGYLPLAATLTTEKVYRSFRGRYDEFKTFFHGHTYTANPLACAVALANLRLYRKDDVVGGLEGKIRMLGDFLRGMRSHPSVGDVRQAGLMAGIELVKDQRTGRPFEAALKVGQRVCRECRNQGVWVRPLSDVIVILPPLSIRSGQLRRLLSVVGRAIVQVTKML